MATILSIDGILDRIKEQLDLKAQGSTFPFVVFDVCDHVDITAGLTQLNT